MKILISCKLKRISGNGVVLEKAGADEIFRSIESMVIATGYRAQRVLIRSFYFFSHPIRIIGYSGEPRDAMVAIYEGSEAAREI